MRLHGDGFEHLRPRCEGGCAHQPEAGLSQQLCELRLGALAVTRVRQVIATLFEATSSPSGVTHVTFTLAGV